MKHKTVLKRTELLIFTVILICLTFPFQCSAADDNNRELLLSKGFPEAVLNSVSGTVSEKLFSSVGSYEIADISTETEYYPENIAENADLAVKTVSVKLRDKQSGLYMGETVCVYWEWLDNKPAIREEDYLSLKWSDDRVIFDSDSFYAEDYSKKNVQDNWTVRRTYDKPGEIKQNGVVHWTDLHEYESSVGGVMILRLMPEAFEFTESKNTLSCEYVHYITALPTTVLYALVFAFSAAFMFVVIKKKKH